MDRVQSDTSASVVTNSDVSGLAAVINHRLAADALIARAISFGWICGGGAIALCLAGLGFATAFYGYSYMISVKPATEDIARALAAAMERAKFTTTISGDMKLSPTEFTLAPSVVRLQDGSQVKLDPKSSIRVIGDIKVDIPQPSISQLQLGTREGGELPFTTYTVFTDVDSGKGYVETGWAYDISDMTRPKAQSCHYLEALDQDVSARYLLAVNGEPRVPSRKTPFNYEQALASCIWFSGL